MTFAPTNLRDLETEIKDGILAITPSLEPGRPWNHDEGTAPSGPSQRARMFFLEWSDVRQVVGGATGNLDYEVSADLEVTTHYWAINPDMVGEVLSQDHFDINRHFVDRLETIVGLTNWEPVGYVVVDEESRQYAHQYTVSYLRR